MKRHLRIASAASAVAVVSAMVAVMVANVDRDAAHAGAVTTSTTGTATHVVSFPVAQTSAVGVAPRTVFVVGDSLTVGTTPYLRSTMHRRGWRLTGVDARVGRPVSEGLRVLQQDRARLPATVVIALGTNDLGAPAREVAGWMKTARRIVGARRLVWVNLCLNDATQPRLHDFRRLNALLAQFATRRQIQLADWCSYAHRRGIVPGPDGIHYGPADYRLRAAFYALVLGPTTPAISRDIASRPLGVRWSMS